MYAFSLFLRLWSLTKLVLNFGVTVIKLFLLLMLLLYGICFIVYIVAVLLCSLWNCFYIVLLRLLECHVACLSDRTCKIWDLSNSEEILTLDGHPNNVVGVQYAEMTSLVYTVSAYVMKVWDPRRGNVCIKTLTLVTISAVVCNSIIRVVVVILLLTQVSNPCDVWVRGHCRINPLRFLAECRKRQLHQGSFVLLYFRLSALFDLYLVFVCLFSCIVFVFSCTALFVNISQWPILCRVGRWTLLSQQVTGLQVTAD